MSRIHIRGRHTRDPLRNPTPEELATRLQDDGLRCGGVAKIQTEYLERRQRMPEMIFCDPLPKDAWRQIAVRLRKERSKFSVDSDVYEDLSIAVVTAENMPHGVSLWDALVHQCESCEAAYGESRRFAQGLLRHHGYIVCESYAGRNVG